MDKDTNLSSELLEIDPRGGDLRSDSETIHAIRQGVEIERRIAVLDVVDHRGDKHQVPLLLTDSGEAGATVAVAADIIKETQRLAAGPLRRAGSVQLGSLPSLIEYVNRYKRQEETIAFAPLDPASVTVIFDYHPRGGELAAWREDRATFTCPPSRQWRLWTGAAGKPMTQDQFGEFVEFNIDDIGPGDPAADIVAAPDLLKVARELVIHNMGVFERSKNPTTGEASLVVKQEHGTKSTKIPRAFRLAIPVFEGSDQSYALECRIRFEMKEGRPVFTFLIYDQADVWEDALKELREKLGEACSIPVYVGTPPAAAR